MTKRFTLAYEKGNWWAVRDGDITLWKEEVIHLLNELATKCSQLKKENEQLKQDKTNLYRTMSRDRVRYNQFKDKVFWCIGKKIKLLKDCHMTNEARILEDLQKEIVDDGND